MAVITTDEVKTLLQISGTAKDDLIDMLIPLVEGTIREITGQDWQDSPTVPSWQPWMKLPASKMIGYNLDPGSIGMKSESQGGYSYTKADMVNGYPSDIVKQFESVTVIRPLYGQKLTQYNDRRGLTEKQIVDGVVLNSEPGLPYAD